MTVPNVKNFLIMKYSQPGPFMRNNLSNKSTTLVNLDALLKNKSIKYKNQIQFLDILVANDSWLEKETNKRKIKYCLLWYHKSSSTSNSK